MAAQHKALKSICAVAGLAVAIGINVYFGFQLNSPEFGLFFIKLIVLPVLIAFGVSLFLADTNPQWRAPAVAFNWVAAGVELGYFVLGWRVLLEWYRTPNEPRLEPLFVAITVAVAVIEYCRVTLRRAKQRQGTFEKIVKDDDD